MPITDPTDIAGLYAWYDADQLGLANNDPVTSWTDESGGGRHATEAITTPLFKTNIQNGKPGILFDGTDDDLTATFAADASRSIFIVAKSNATTAKFLLGTLNTSARLSNQTTGWRWNSNQAGAAVDFGGTVTNTSLITLVFTSTSSAAGYIDGGSATSFDPNDAYSTQTTWTIGSANGSFWFNGYVFEVVVYDSALGTTDREDVEDYLIAKWITPPSTTKNLAALGVG